MPTCYDDGAELTVVQIRQHETNLVLDDEEPGRELLRDIRRDYVVEVTLTARRRGGSGAVEGVIRRGAHRRRDARHNGWELLRAVSERDERVALAVITGWGELVSTHEEKAARVEWVLTKPFSMSQISEVAREIVRRKEGREGGPQLTLVA